MNRTQQSVLHLQLGQEVIYLLLMSSILANVLLAAIAIRSSSEVHHLRSQIGALISKIDASDQPPIIVLRETDGFSFAPGSAEISPEFLVRLKEFIPRLSELSDRYQAQVVEVVGHTDGVAVSQRLRALANLDELLGQYVESSAGYSLIPYDNVGLGMSRAVSVSRALRENGLPQKFDIQPLSAANLISPSDRAAPAPAKIDDPTRRRIEIRMRRAGANRNE
jgi:outer membrane protein OmpA-like peptidoglycan-associated protein